MQALRTHLGSPKRWAGQIKEFDGIYKGNDVELLCNRSNESIELIKTPNEPDHFDVLIEGEFVYESTLGEIEEWLNGRL